MVVNRADKKIPNAEYQRVTRRIRTNAKSSIDNSIENSAESNVENNAENSIENSAESNVENNAENSIENSAESNLENNVENSVENSAESNVENKAENSIENSAESNVENKAVRKTSANDKFNEQTDDVVVEQAIALIYNGISHAVMMATPTDLYDFALGFSLNEGIISSINDLIDFEVVVQAAGIELQLTISSRQFSALKTQRRQLAGNSGCGLCGVESLAQTVKQRPPVQAQALITHVACQRALVMFAELQTMKQHTGGVHGAALCDSRSGELLIMREDVGRHNALDKLIGAAVRRHEDATPEDYFILVSSRASYEMVDKTIAAGYSHLVSMSAATSKAIAWATQHQLNLIAFAKNSRQVVYAENITDDCAADCDDN